MATTVVFYAHKGGTGRSAAVANVAPVLSRAGYRVLIVDFDLEAPGIHRYFNLPDSECQRGVVELVEDWKTSLERGAPQLPVLPPFLEPRFEPLSLISGETLTAAQVRDRILGTPTIGRETPLEAWVKLLPAGRLDDTYRSRAAAIDWAALYRRPEWRAFFGWFKKTLSEQADIVLIDSRAGVTDMGALCLFALADRVVFLTPPTHQGLDGVLATARHLRPETKALLVVSRVSADADRTHLGHWLHSARLKAAELPNTWLDVRTAKEASEMVDRWQLPEVPVHAVGEPLVRLRMLERGITQDVLADAYQKLGSEIRKWIVSLTREVAQLQDLQTIGTVNARIADAQQQRDVNALSTLWGRLAEVILKQFPDRQQLDDAREAAHRGLALAEALGKEELAAHYVHLLGWADHQDGDFEAAIKRYEEAAKRWGKAPGADVLPLMRHTGDAFTSLGQYDNAIKVLSSALELATDPASLERALVLEGLARVAWVQGRWNTAAQGYQIAADAAPDTYNGRETKARNLANAVPAYQLLSMNDTAREIAKRVEDLARHDSPPNPITQAHAKRAHASVETDKEKAFELCLMQLEDLAVGQPSNLLSRGVAKMQQAFAIQERDPAQAEVLFREANQFLRAQRCIDWNMLAIPTNNYAKLLHLNGKIDDAHALIRDVTTAVPSLRDYLVRLTIGDQLAYWADKFRLANKSYQDIALAALSLKRQFPGKSSTHALAAALVAYTATSREKAKALLQEANEFAPNHDNILRAFILEVQAKWTENIITATALRQQAQTLRQQAQTLRKQAK